MKCFLTILLIAVITASIVGCVMVIYVVGSFRNDAGIPDLDNISLNESSIIYLMNQETGEFEEHQRLEGTKAIWTDLSEIPLNMQHAVVAIEDKRFYDHYGVDWKRTVSAFANLIVHYSSQEFGGSTITQQLVKVLTQESDHKIERKITEILRAIEMERNYYTKDEILEAYLNVLPLSGNVVGVGAAANYYFGKDVQDLTLAECALIAGITQNPPNTIPIPIRKISVSDSASCCAACMSKAGSRRMNTVRPMGRSFIFPAISSTLMWRIITPICSSKMSSRI